MGIQRSDSTETLKGSEASGGLPASKGAGADEGLQTGSAKLGLGDKDGDIKALLVVLGAPVPAWLVAQIWKTEYVEVVDLP